MAICRPPDPDQPARATLAEAKLLPDELCDLATRGGR